MTVTKKNGPKRKRVANGTGKERSRSRGEALIISVGGRENCSIEEDERNASRIILKEQVPSGNIDAGDRLNASGNGKKIGSLKNPLASKSQVGGGQFGSSFGGDVKHAKGEGAEREKGREKRFAQQRSNECRRKTCERYCRG